MSAKSGDIFGPLLCEMILELIRQKAWSLEMLKEHTCCQIKKEEPLNALAGIPSYPLQPEPSGKSPKQHIEDTRRATGLKIQTVLGKYGQGDLEINGQKAGYTVVDRSERCGTCAIIKRDCFRVMPDQFWQSATCASCYKNGQRCNFVGEGGMEVEEEG